MRRRKSHPLRRPPPFHGSPVGTPPDPAGTGPGFRQIRERIAAEQYVLTKHAYDQMTVRDIYVRQVVEAVLNGRVVRTWHHPQYKKIAVIGTRFNGDHLKIVIKVAPTPQIITVCFPYEDLD